MSWLPSHGLLRDHHDYASKCTDGPTIYHVASMATTMAALCADRASLVIEATPYPLHLWTMLIGRSTIDRKTTSTRLAIGPMEDLYPNRVARVYGSPEGLWNHMNQHPCLCIYVPEGGAFFAQREAGYWRHAKDIWMDLYDYQKNGVTRQLAKQSITINKPRVSMLAATAYPLLQRYTRDTDWLGGFLARFLMISGEPGTPKPRLTSDPKVELHIQGLLKNVFQTDWGVMGITTQARAILDEFADEIRAGLDEFAPGLHPALNRLPDTAHRLAAIYEISAQAASPPAKGRIVLVGADAAAGAVSLCRASRDQTLVHLAELTETNPQKQVRAQIETIIRRAGIGGITRAGLLRATRLRADELEKWVSTLDAAQTISYTVSTPTKASGGRTVTRYVHAEAAADAQKLQQAAAKNPRQRASWVDLSGKTPPNLSSLPVAKRQPWVPHDDDELDNLWLNDDIDEQDLN